jgi:hypothetical protein
MISGTLSDNFSSIFCTPARLGVGCSAFGWSGNSQFQPISGVARLSISNSSFTGDNLTMQVSWIRPVNLIVTPDSYLISSTDGQQKYEYSLNPNATSITLSLPNNCIPYTVSIQVRRSTVLTPPTNTLVTPRISPMIGQNCVCSALISPCCCFY